MTTQTLAEINVLISPRFDAWLTNAQKADWARKESRRLQAESIRLLNIARELERDTRYLTTTEVERGLGALIHTHA